MNGRFVEEIVTGSYFEIKDGFPVIENYEYADHTGLFWFEFESGKQTRKYSEKTAPKWLLDIRNKCLQFEED